MGLWHTNGSPYIGENTRPYTNQQKRVLANGWPQNKNERNWKEL